eukprot:scaffold96529_cov78-Cyclotella_meneghiniana.AAC.14
MDAGPAYDEINTLLMRKNPVPNVPPTPTATKSKRLKCRSTCPCVDTGGGCSSFVRGGTDKGNEGVSVLFSFSCDALYDCIESIDPKDCRPPSNGNDSDDICNGFRKNGLEFFLASGRIKEDGLLPLPSRGDEPIDADLRRLLVLWSSSELLAFRAWSILLSTDVDDPYEGTDEGWGIPVFDLRKDVDSVEEGVPTYH